MAETYIQMFEETWYPELFAIIAEKTIQRFQTQKAQIADDWKREMKQYLKLLAEKQEQSEAGLIREINLSFLFTSLEQTPKFRVDSYEEGGRTFTQSVLTGYLRADWMTADLEELTDAVLTKAREEKLQRYIRPAEAEVLKLRAARSLLYYFALRFKYMVPEFLDTKLLAKIHKAPAFTLGMGEYLDWQKTIYAVFPEVDIFNCDRKTELRFRNFPAIFYQNKIFENVNLTQSKFQDCTFLDSDIQMVKMDDCTFDGCVFENVKITQTQMAGSLFIRCTFRNTQWKDTVFFKDGTEEKEPDYFEPAEFYECEFADSCMENCTLTGCFVTDCEMEGLELLSCKTRNSGFWNEASGDADGEA